MSSLKEIKRKKIIEAAIEQFGIYGYNASMDSIAKLADVSKQTLYAHFKKKDALYEQCMKEKVLQSQLGKVEFDLSKPMDKVLLMFAKIFHAQLLKPGAMRTYRNAVSQVETHPSFSATYLEHGPEKAVKSLAYYLNEKEKEGLIKLQLSCDDSAIQLLLMLHGKAVYWRYLGEDIQQTEEQRDLYLKSCVDMFLNHVKLP